MLFLFIPFGNSLMVSQLHNLMIHFFLNIIYNIFIKDFSVNMNNKAVNIHIANIHIFWFNIIIPKFKPKYTGLFIFTFIFLISIANKSSQNQFVVWYLGSDTNWYLIFISCYISMYGFSHVSWFHCITLCTFLIS